jgi:hypothetical protein
MRWQWWEGPGQGLLARALPTPVPTTAPHEAALCALGLEPVESPQPVILHHPS